MKRLIPAWLDGELEPTRRDAVAKHLAVCVVCRAEMAALRADRQALVSSRTPEPSPYLLTRVMAEARRIRPSRVWLTVPALRAAAAVLVVAASLGVGVLLGRGFAGGTQSADTAWSLSYSEPVVVDVYEPALGGE
ncbi:MAG: zf-HC2 domain-containing protein [candidate division WOR-3 bacterium]